MKHLKSYEGKNTMNWYSRTLYTNDIEEFLEFYYKLISNPNVEDIKLFTVNKLGKNTRDAYIFAVYTNKNEFKGMSQLTQENFDKIRKFSDEYTNDEIDEWLENWDARHDMNKYNL